MDRVIGDNDLLAACRIQGKAAAYAALAGLAVGCVWFLCVAWRAGVL